MRSRNEIIAERRLHVAATIVVWSCAILALLLLSASGRGDEPIIDQPHLLVAPKEFRADYDGNDPAPLLALITSEHAVDDWEVEHFTSRELLSYTAIKGTDGRVIAVSAPAGTKLLITQFRDPPITPRRVRVAIVLRGSGVTPVPPRPPDDDKTGPLGNRTVPKAEEPPGTIKDKLTALKAWSAKNKEASLWFAEYFYDFRLLAEKKPSRFPNVGHVRNHNAAAMPIWNISTPDIKVTESPTPLLNKAMLDVFGDEPTKKIVASDLKRNLNAMVWAFQP